MKKSIEARRSEALVKWLASTTARISRLPNREIVGDHVYVVGGAVRDFLLEKPVKDIDLVIDSVALGGFDSARYAKELKNLIPTSTDLTTNNYGVAILSVKGEWALPDADGEMVSMKGEVIEIANARSESYDPSEGDLAGKGYKPTSVQPTTIDADVVRREFTFNSLMWRMSDLLNGPENAEVIDLTGKGIVDLAAGRMRTPSEPDVTFTDDPSRMVRAVKFASRYGWEIDDEVADSIRRNADSLTDIPADALGQILTASVLPYGESAIKSLGELGLLPVLGRIYESNKPFAATMEGWLADEDPKEVVKMLNAGLPFDPPWKGLPFEESLYRDAIMRATSGQTFLAAVKQPTKFVGDKSWFIRMTKDHDINPKDFGPMLREIAAALLLEEPDYALEPQAFRLALEGLIEEQIHA